MNHPAASGENVSMKLAPAIESEENGDEQ